MLYNLKIPVLRCAHDLKKRTPQTCHLIRNSRSSSGFRPLSIRPPRLSQARSAPLSPQENAGRNPRISTRISTALPKGRPQGQAKSRPCLVLLFRFGPLDKPPELTAQSFPLLKFAPAVPRSFSVVSGHCLCSLITRCALCDQWSGGYISQRWVHWNAPNASRIMFNKNANCRGIILARAAHSRSCLHSTSLVVMFPSSLFLSCCLLSRFRIGFSPPKSNSKTSCRLFPAFPPLWAWFVLLVCSHVQNPHYTPAIRKVWFSFEWTQSQISPLSSSVADPDRE